MVASAVGPIPSHTIAAVEAKLGARVHGCSSVIANGTTMTGAYEQLKELTRGREGITRESLHAFIRGLSGLPQAERDRLLRLTPASYIGMAAELARRI